MENYMNYTEEELAELLAKAQKEAEAAIAKMTPEERAQADARAKQLIEEDATSMQRLYEESQKLINETAPKKIPKFCTNCGAPAGSGKYCEYCGSLLSSS